MEGVGTKQTGKARRKEKRLQSEPSSTEGGKNGGPRGVNVLDFAEARAMELSSMLKAIRSKSGSKRIFQLLPRHMRRRAMSHNLKRLPRRLRAVASKEIQGSEADVKPPSRRQRRKVKNLREEYSRRQRSYMWLETHLWHAKRMHMTNKWGYRLPNYVNVKGVRSTYRSLIYGCLLLDMSYYQCIQVSGDMDNIISTLSSLFSTETGLSIGAKAFTKGQREGIAIMYHDGTYPFHPVGPVQFLWNVVPAKVGQREQGVESEVHQLSLASKLWIFCHPAMYQEAIAEIQKAISKHDLCRSNQVSKSDHDTSSSGVGGVSRVGGVNALLVQGLKDELLRFRLLGPRSHAVLMEVLRPFFHFSDDGSSSDSVGSDAPPPTPWWKGQQHVLQEHSSVLSSVYPAIRGAPTSSSFSRGTAIGMVVRDPRLFLPSTRTDMVSSFYPEKVTAARRHTSHVNDECDSEDEDEGLSKAEIPMGNIEPALDGKYPVTSTITTTCTVPVLPSLVAYSPLWDDDVRRVVSLSRQPDHFLNEARSKQFPKQGDLDIGDSVRIPVVILHQSLSNVCSPTSLDKPTGFGWDLLLPKNWGMAFWVSLVYRGARVCGLTELQRCLLECRVLQFPNDFPDTLACRQESQVVQEGLENFFRCYPPDKRPNYGKLSIRTPFHCSWETLLLDDCDVMTKKPRIEPLSYHGVLSCGNSVASCFYVLRSRTHLTALSQLMDHASHGGRQKSQRKGHESPCLHSDTLSILKQTHSNALVAISFEMFGRGKVSSWAALCVPTLADLRSLVENNTYSGPVEPINRRGVTVVSGNFVLIGTSHVSKKQRRAVLKEAKSKLSTRVESGSTSTRVKSGSTSTEVQSNSTSITAQSSLDGQTKCSSLEDLKLQSITPSRQVMGYATRMGYQLSTSKFGGLGFISLSKLIEAIELSCAAGVGHIVCLARSHGTQYRFVKLQLLT